MVSEHLQFAIVRLTNGENSMDENCPICRVGTIVLHVIFSPLCVFVVELICVYFKNSHVNKNFFEVAQSGMIICMLPFCYCIQILLYPIHLLAVC